MIMFTDKPRYLSVMQYYYYFLTNMRMLLCWLSNAIAINIATKLLLRLDVNVANCGFCIDIDINCTFLSSIHIVVIQLFWLKKAAAILQGVNLKMNKINMCCDVLWCSVLCTLHSLLLYLLLQKKIKEQLHRYEMEITPR